MGQALSPKLPTPPGWGPPSPQGCYWQRPRAVGSIGIKETVKAGRSPTCAGRPQSHGAAHPGEETPPRVPGHARSRAPAEARTRGGERDPGGGGYLASWALLVGLGGTESPPEGPRLRASEGTLRVLR